MTVQTAAMTIFIWFWNNTPSNGVCWIQNKYGQCPGGTGFFLSPGGAAWDRGIWRRRVIIRPHISTTGRAAVGRTGVAEVSALQQKAVLATSKVMLSIWYVLTLLTKHPGWGTRCFFSRQRKRKMQPMDLPLTMRVSPIMAIVHTWWLRSPRRMNPDSAGTVNEKGAVIGEWVGQTNAAPPCLQPEAGLCPPRFCSRWRQRYC